MKTFCVYLLTALTAFADLPAEWKNVQTFEVTAPGLIKLSLPAETLNAARPGLEDLRVLDADGREVSFLLSRPVGRTATVLKPAKFSTSIVGTTTIILIETSGQDLLEGVTLETSASGFIKAATVEGSNDQKTWKTLATGQPLSRDASGFPWLQLSFTEGKWSWLRVTVDDKRSEAVLFTGARLHGSIGEQVVGEPVRATLIDRTENNGQTRLTLDLGAANLTLSSVRIETDEPSFTRMVTVAARQVSENAMTEYLLTRGAFHGFAVGELPQSHALHAPVPTRELLVLIDNQDSPPVFIKSVTVRRWPVYAVFHATQAGTYRILTGNPRCVKPRYDMGALRNALTVAQLPTTEQAFGPVTSNPSYRPAEPLPEIEKLGAVLDVSEWSCRKRLEITRVGVQQVELDLDVLAHADPSFRDLRLMRDGQQRPYIVERTSIQRKLVPEVSMVNDPKRPTVSRWTIKLPKSRLPVTRLTCMTPTELFRRDVRLYEEPVDGRGEKYVRGLANASWVRTPPGTTRALELSFSPPVTDTLILEADNGDNPAIQLENIVVYYPATRLWFKVPAAPATWLYYSNREASLPQYDLDLIAPRLLAEEKAMAKLGPEEVLKKSGASEFLQLAGTKSLVFWVALGVVVMVLLVVISRLLPKNPSGN